MPCETDSTPTLRERAWLAPKAEHALSLLELDERARSGALEEPQGLRVDPFASSERSVRRHAWARYAAAMGLDVAVAGDRCHLCNPPLSDAEEDRVQAPPMRPPQQDLNVEDCSQLAIAPALERTAFERKLRSMCYKVRDGLRSAKFWCPDFEGDPPQWQHVSQPRVRACGYAVISERVSIVVREDGAARYMGLARCGSVWECPVCRAKICAGRRAEVTAAVEAFGPEHTAMLTVTIRHEAGDDLRCLRKGLTKCWRAMTRGKPWKRFKGRAGLAGVVRALEVTHGPNGWHPHIHALLFLDDERSSYALLEAELAWLKERWRRIVVRHMGQDQEPNDAHGLDLRPVNQADYISKLGLELNDTFTKRPSEGRRTPFQIAAHVGRFGRQRDCELWRIWCEAMRGARHLTWSRGLKRSLAIAEKTDEALAAEADELTAADRIVATIAAADWELLRKGRGRTVSLLRVLERDGLALFHSELESRLTDARQTAAKGG